MTRFEEFKKMNIDEFAKWIDEHIIFDGSPWCEWFDESYCQKCEPIMLRYEDGLREFPASWCEVNDNKCKFFPDMDHAPDIKDIAKMWLEQEA